LRHMATTSTLHENRPTGEVTSNSRKPEDLRLSSLGNNQSFSTPESADRINQKNQPKKPSTSETKVDDTQEKTKPVNSTDSNEATTFGDDPQAVDRINNDTKNIVKLERPYLGFKDLNEQQKKLLVDNETGAIVDSHLNSFASGGPARPFVNGTPPSKNINQVKAFYDAWLAGAILNTSERNLAELRKYPRLGDTTRKLFNPIADSAYNTLAPSLKLLFPNSFPEIVFTTTAPSNNQALTIQPPELPSATSNSFQQLIDITNHQASKHKEQRRTEDLNLEITA
jgi:hypothetical protein